jgi:hypothetical protein
MFSAITGYLILEPERLLKAGSGLSYLPYGGQLLSHVRSFASFQFREDDLIESDEGCTGYDSTGVTNL